MKRKTQKLPELPASHLCALDDAGFVSARYLNESILVQIDGAERSEWLPALCIRPGYKPNTYAVIEWLPIGHPANNYSFSGWSVMDGHTSGGMCETILQALSWFSWHEAQRESAVRKMDTTK